MRDGYRKGFLGIMAMVCAAAMISCGTPSIEDSDTVMEIAGQPVVKAEYQMVLKHYAPEVKRQYSTEEANAENFWEMEEGRPLEQVMELAEEDLTRKKVVAQLAGEAGIEEKADYLSIMEGMGAENTEREGKVSSGEVVYGLTSFAPEDYYSYVYTSLESQLLEKLKSSHPISDEELEEIYQENQGQYTSEVRVHMLVGEMQPEADGAGGRQAEQSQSEAGMETAQQVKDSMEGGAEIDVLTEQYPQVNFYEIEMSSFQTEEGPAEYRILGDSPSIGVILYGDCGEYEWKPAPEINKNMYYTHSGKNRLIKVYKNKEEVIRASINAVLAVQRALEDGLLYCGFIWRYEER